LTSQANADYTPSDVLSRITASRKTVSNATFECVWKISEGGSSKWERQTFYWDDLGRRRIIAHGGPLSQDGKMLEDEDPTSRDDFFNGEIVVDAESHPKWDRNGGKPASPKDADGYNNAIISDAASGLRSALQTLRNPLEYMSNVAVNEIAVAIKSGTVAAHPAENGRVAVDIKHTEPDSPYAKSVITVMPKHNWAIESVRSYRSDGKLAREIVSDYKEQADGLWVPIRLHHTHWGDRNQDDTPCLDWRFETTKAIFNDPSFDQHVFDVRLKRDTWVSDTRNKLTHRVGEEEVVASVLARDLARSAAEADAHDPAKAPSLVGKALPRLRELKIEAAPAEVSGRMILLCFFDMQERPSRHALAELVKQAADLKSGGVFVAGVQVHPVGRTALEGFARTNHITFPVGMIATEEEQTKFNWGLKSQPWLILTDKEHIVRAEGFTPAELNDKLSPLR
jgi:hypothetical protein